MIQIYFLNVEEVSSVQFRQNLHIVPASVQKEVMKYKFEKDQKFKLYGKLMVQNYCLENTVPFHWNNWQISAYGKPFLTEGPHFNISHSGKYVVVAFSAENIGIDIEFVNTENIDAMIRFLHPKEQKNIKKSINKTDAFYEIWTKKEAFLKAKGVGMNEDLNQKDCSLTTILDNQNWYFKTLDILKGYKVSICTPVKFIESVKAYNIKEIYKTGENQLFYSLFPILKV